MYMRFSTLFFFFSTVVLILFSPQCGFHLVIFQVFLLCSKMWTPRNQDCLAIPIVYQDIQYLFGVLGWVGRCLAGYVDRCMDEGWTSGTSSLPHNCWNPQDLMFGLWFLAISELQGDLKVKCISENTWNYKAWVKNLEYLPS